MQYLATKGFYLGNWSDMIYVLKILLWQADNLGELGRNSKDNSDFDQGRQRRREELNKSF